MEIEMGFHGFFFIGFEHYIMQTEMGFHGNSNWF